MGYLAIEYMLGSRGDFVLCSAWVDVRLNDSMAMTRKLVMGELMVCSVGETLG